MTNRNYEHNVVLTKGGYDVIGTRPIRPDGADKVTGRALYGADFSTVGLLHGKTLRSPHAHARIKSIDTKEAESLYGVKAIATAADMPSAGDDIGLKRRRQNILASGKTLYKGHAIIGVAATSAHVAEQALSLIKVDYEVLPSVTTAPDAMAESAPNLHDDLYVEEYHGDSKNVGEYLRHELGDVEDAFSSADVVVERDFHMKTVHQGYIEPHNVTALWNKDDRIHIWTSTQGSFAVRTDVSELLSHDESKIRVIPMEIGGGFGGKINVYEEPVAAILSKKSGQPVKMVMSRQEVFECTGPTCGSYGKIKLGATSDGKIVAAQAYLAFESGGFPGSSMVESGAKCVFAPYDIPNILIDGYGIVTNKPKTAAYRAPGSPNAAFPAESVIDELALKLGIDALEFRLMNAAKEGTRRADGPVYPRIGCVEVLEAMRDHPHYNTPIEGSNRGRGVAVGFWFNAGLESTCAISVNPNGTVNVVEGSTDIGGSRASISMQAAEVLGIKTEDVHTTIVDTDSIGFTGVTGGSRTTFATGYAAHDAAQDVKKQLIERAARIWGVDADSVEMTGGVLKSKSDVELAMSFKELASDLNDTGGPIIGRGAVNPPGIGGSFAGNIVDVEVDPDTGKVAVLRFTAVQDAGKAIHPSYVEGQMQGGSAQGIGWALNEEYFMTDDGRMANSTLLDYRMPTSLDLPMIDTVIVEVPNPGHPFGVRGVGEANIVPPTPAMANAINDAIGVRMTSLPMNPPAIMDAVWRSSK